MASDKRPGGLTALAVINFIWGGFTALGAIGLAVLIPLMGSVMDQASGQMTPEQQAQMAALRDVSGPLFMTLIFISAVTAALLIASGVGYLKLKKFLGRTLGNAYGVISVVYAIAAGMLLPVELGGGFNIATIIGLIYPVLTLILLNTTFKEDFVN
jgi:hypothetical protein